jgi:hypothetical protein
MFNVFKKTEYVQYSPDLEKVHPNESALIDETAQHIKSLILQNFNKHSHAYRGTHLKTQGLVKGTMTVRDNLSEDFIQGLFQPGKVYNVIMRYANEPFKIDPDTTPGPRGVGMKVFLDRDKTQDILMNNAPILELTDVETTRDIFAIRDKYFEDQEGMEKELKKRDDTKKQMAPFQLPNTDIMGMQFFQQAPFRFGPYIGKFSLVPSKSQYAKTHGKVPKDASPTILREWIEEYYLDSDAEYTLSVQLCENVDTEPIEDTSVEWKTTFHELADIVFPKQEAFSAKRRVFWEEKMRLDPWAGMEQHKPVGGVNRVRRGVYGKSREQRQDLNRTQTEAVSWEDIPE